MMPPASTMVNTAVDVTSNKDEMRKPRPHNVDFRINESTKKRLLGKSQAAGAAIATERKSAVDAALGRHLDDTEFESADDDGLKVMPSKGGIPASNVAPPAVSTSGIRRRPSTVRRVKDVLGTSEHSSARRRRSISREKGPRPVSRRDREIDERDLSSRDPLCATEQSRNQESRTNDQSKDASSRVSRSSDNSGNLGSMLDQMSIGKPKKKGGRSVASIPADHRVNQRSSDSVTTSAAEDISRGLEPLQDECLGEEDLKNEEESGGSATSMSVSTSNERGRDLRGGRKKTDRERAASPGPIIKKRSESPGPFKKRTTASPGSIRKRSESLDPTKKQSGSSSTLKSRSSSPGPLKKRSESPGPLKKRSESPGPLKKRSQSPGALSSRRRSSNESTQKMRSERVSRPGDEDGALGSMLEQVTGEKPKKRGARSVASAPVHDLRRPERRPSVGIPQKNRPSQRTASGEGKSGPPKRTKSVDAADILSVTSEMGEYDWQGYRPPEHRTSGKEELVTSEKTQSTDPAGGSSRTENNGDAPQTAASERRAAMAKIKRSFSATAGSQTRSTHPETVQISPDMRTELAKHKVKRNNSMGAQGPRNDPSGVSGGDNEGNGGQKGVKRAQSMLLHREMTRRGKSNSLADLVQYKEEEIHSTSYFASNHVLINRERMKRGLRPLTRNIAMDELARQSAEAMASSNGLNPLKTTYVGNVLRGESIRSIHRSTMQQKQGRERSNLLNPYFQDFGVGTAKGEDGMLYMCQLFSERLELALTDTTSS